MNKKNYVIVGKFKQQIFNQTDNKIIRKINLRWMKRKWIIMNSTSLRTGMTNKINQRNLIFVVIWWRLFLNIWLVTFFYTSRFRLPHSEIEKNRRKKMNKCLSDLAACLFKGPVNKKIDKLSILKMTVAHMKNLKG